MMRKAAIAFLPLGGALLLTAAVAPPSLRPGLWEIATTPERATLDGRALADLPYAPPPAERLCMSAAQAADPVRWFTRDSGKGCRFAKRSVAGGRVAISGTCPSLEAGQAVGTTMLAGQWTPVTYALRFATIAHGANGTMGFDGRVMAKWIGTCAP